MSDYAALIRPAAPAVPWRATLGRVSAARAGKTPARFRPRRRLADAGWMALVLWLGLVPPPGASAEEAVEAPLAIESLLLDGAAAGSRLVVVGDRGHILVSADGGASWSQAEVPTRALLTAVHMRDERTGWAVGHDAVILRTRDGGESWAMVHRAPEEELPLLDVWFRDERTGFAVGAYGYFLATADGGDTWTPRVISEDDFHLNALFPAGGEPTESRGPESQRSESQQTESQQAESQRPGSQRPASQPPESQRLYIAAEAGVAYRSDDGGETWRELPSPYAGSWFGGLALDDERVLLAGLRGHLFRSEDAGETWTEVPTDTNATLTGAVRLPSGAILITGLEGALLTSRDDGRSVTTERLPSREGISDALPLGGDGVLLIGEFGVRNPARDE